jgi:tartrate dehydratase beta subunit/fumarate hydratase class I family protein
VTCTGNPSSPAVPSTMEAICKITVKDFPAFIIVDDKRNDFFEKILT